MKRYIQFLEECILFKQIPPEESLNMLELSQYTITTFAPNEMIALEGEPCTHLGVILKGSIESRKISPSGKIITLAHFSIGDLFGEPIVFSATKLYPASIFATTDTEILFIHRKDVFTLCQKSPQFMENFMQTLSDKTLYLTRKIQLLTLTTIRQKICSYLLEQYKQQNSETLTLPISRKQMAELLGVQRPSLSREFINMRDEGLIDFKGNTVTIHDLHSLEEAMFQ